VSPHRSRALCCAAGLTLSMGDTTDTVILLHPPLIPMADPYCSYREVQQIIVWQWAS
jgi:hypothetical protein